MRKLARISQDDPDATVSGHSLLLDVIHDQATYLAGQIHRATHWQPQSVEIVLASPAGSILGSILY